jgi:O-antigen/teichoic acid export membrane protein
VIRQLFRSQFARSVAVLTGGTAFAQGLGILALPLLTRLYTPEDFGVLGIFAALLGTISVASALRYDIAIPLPKDDLEAAHLLLVALISVCAMGLLTKMILIFLAAFADPLGAPAIGKHLWLLPIGVLLTGAYSIFQYWAIRKKAYTRMARTRLGQAIGGVGSQLVLGWSGAGAVGLIVGQVISNGAGFLGLARKAWIEEGRAFRQIRFRGLFHAAYEYRRFPKYSVLEALANTSGFQLPLLLIAMRGNGAELGYLMLVMRVLQAPMSLIGASAAQVFYREAMHELENKKLEEFVNLTVRRLALLSFPPLATAALIAPFVFGPIFGQEWGRAGQLVAWMAPFLFFQFLVSPISIVLQVLDKSAVALLLQLFGLVLRVTPVYLLPTISAEVFAVSSAAFYLLYLFVVLAVVRAFGSDRRLKSDKADAQ